MNDFESEIGSSNSLDCIPMELDSSLGVQNEVSHYNFQSRILQQDCAIYWL